MTFVINIKISPPVQCVTHCNCKSKGHDDDDDDDDDDIISLRSELMMGRYGSAMKNTFCSGRGSGIGFQSLQDNLEQSVTPVPEDPVPPLASGGTACTPCTDILEGK